MRYFLPICVLLVFSVMAFAQVRAEEQQEASTTDSQPDTSGERLKKLLRDADELEEAGKQDEAATIHKKAGQERRALLSRLDSLQTEVEQIRKATGSVPQVLFHLKVYEVSLTKLRRLGYNLAKLQGKAVESPDDVKDAPNGTFSTVADGNEALQAVEELRKNNLAKIISEPILATINGEKAIFTDGGQIPIAQLQKDGSKQIEYKDYGTQMELTPRVLGDHTVRLSLHYRISELDYAHSMQIGKDSFPGIRSRVVATSAELQDGQTLVLSGLNQIHVEKSESGVPIASSIPYVGSAFKSVKEERNEIGLVILVRPEIVHASTAAEHRDGDDARR